MLKFIGMVVVGWSVLSVLFLVFVWPSLVVRMERNLEAIERKPPRKRS
jgi:hypothetical protein